MEEPKDNEYKEPAKTGDEKKKDKYGEHVGKFNIKDCSKITDGPVMERKVTDFLCLIIFIAFLGTMIAATIYGFKKGDVAKYIAPLDGQDHFCGIDAGYTDYPHLYLPYLAGEPSEIFDKGVCVKKCPTATSDTLYCAVPGYYCNSDGTVTPSGAAYKTHEVMGYCMPDMDSLATERPDAYEAWKIAFNALLTSNPAGRQIQDLYLSSRAIYWSMALSFVYCMLFIYFMSLFAEFIAWGIVILVQIGLIGATIFCFAEYFTKKSSTTDVSSSSSSSSNGSAKYLWVGIVFAISALLFLLAIWCGFSSLKTAIDVIDAAADFLADTKRLIGVPILYFFITVIFIAIWLGCIMCINSIGDIQPDTGTIIQRRRSERTMAQEKTVLWLFLFMLFGILWICAFIRANSSFVTMVSATTYYFSSKKDDKGVWQDGTADVSLGFKFAYMYHAGSLAFGSFIIALIQLIRIIFMTLAKQAEKASGNNIAVRVIVGCAACCLKCIEKICDYINKSAYAYMSVSGDGFCSSAWNGFLLNVKHILKFGWANFLANAFIVIGKISIVVLNCFSCFMIMKYITKDLDEVSSPASPIAIVGIITYVSASIFLGLFDEAVLSMMTCLAIDMDLNHEPKYGPKTFHDSLSKVEPEGEKKNAINDGGWEKQPNKIDAA